MIINSSAINLSSERSYLSYTSVEAETIEQRADEAAKLDLSKEGKSHDQDDSPLRTESFSLPLSHHP